jgi:hypothetical protein
MPETPQAHEEEERSDYVTVTIGGERITFTDAPMKAWYAPYVARVARAGIITGYRDKSGNLTGKYGTIDNVTLAQLAKIAHEVAGIDEMKARSAPRNQRAKGTWFEKYIASAESLHWQVFSDHRVDPSRPATRGEVTTTLLQALNVLRVWPLGKMFHDVAPTSDYAASIETAAKDDVVSGYTNSYGNPTGQFGPDNPVNRAEMAKFVGNAIDVYIGDSPEILVE